MVHTESVLNEEVRFRSSCSITKSYPNYKITRKNTSSLALTRTRALKLCHTIIHISLGLRGFSDIKVLNCSCHGHLLVLLERTVAVDEKLDSSPSNLSNSQSNESRDSVGTLLSLL